MASLQGHIVELDAVNQMLSSIGERTVNSLESGQADAGEALRILRGVGRQIQMRGWHLNTLRNYKISPDVNDQYVIGDDVLNIDTVRESGHFDVSLRRNAAGTKWVLFCHSTGVPVTASGDVNSDTWTFSGAPTFLIVDQVNFVAYDKLTPAMQHYILARAGRVFQKGAIASTVLWEFSKEEEADALADLEDAEADNEDHNLNKDSSSVFGITFRRNQLWGQ